VITVRFAMATLSALRFPSPVEADDAMETVRELESQGVLRVTGAAVVKWPPRQASPEVRHQLPAISGTSLNFFWDLLFGIIFFLPLSVQASGAKPRDELCPALADIGISGEFVRSVRSRVHENTSALFLLTRDATVDRVVSLLREHRFTVSSTNLTKRQEDSLCAIFAM
jgi:uncharacterized membrane protein